MIGDTHSLWLLFSWGDQGFGDELFWGGIKSLEISILAFAFGLSIGLLSALGSLSQVFFLRHLSAIYAQTFRSVPELVLVLLLYYSGNSAYATLASYFGIVDAHPNGFIVCVLVLGIVAGAYASEILRTAIVAVPSGFGDAARALGMSDGLRFWRITFPALLPLAMPGLANLWLSVLKGSALVSIVGYTELTLAAEQAAGQSKHYLSICIAAQILYLLMAGISQRVFVRAEAWVRPDKAASLGFAR